MVNISLKIKLLLFMTFPLIMQDAISFHSKNLRLSYDDLDTVMKSETHLVLTSRYYVK